MATIIGRSTGYLKNRATDADLKFFLVLVAIGFLAHVTFDVLTLDQILSPKVLIEILLSTIVLLFFLKAVGDSAMTTGEKYISGHRGENAAEKVLVSLPESYTVFRDVMIGQRKGNIDFVVVGPNGVFMVEVKNHFGKIYFDGKELNRAGGIERDLLQQATGQSFGVHEYLRREAGIDWWVMAILLFTNPKVHLVPGTAPLKNVYLTTSPLVRHLIESMPGSLTHPQIERIIAALRKTVHE